MESTVEGKLFHEVGSSIESAVAGKLFGKLCYKIGKKAFCCFFEKCMVFKLNGEAHQEALSLDGSELFDPSKKGRPMKEWVQVPFHYKERWQEFAKAAKNYVGN